MWPPGRRQARAKPFRGHVAPADRLARRGRPRPISPVGRSAVAHAIYAGRNLINGVRAGLFVGVTGEGANIASARWLMAHHGDRIGVRGNNVPQRLPLLCRRQRPRLVRAASPITELQTEQWLVSHQQERHRHEVRKVADRIAAVMSSTRRCSAAKALAVNPAFSAA